MSLAAGVTMGAALYLALEGWARRPRLPRHDERGLLALVTTSAAVEELVWRGPVFRLVCARIGAMTSIAATSAAFAFWHRPATPGDAIRLGVVGSTFAASAMLGGCGSAVAAHVAYDLLVVLRAEPDR
jgi:membrane protease YdiL (CAAX protease family)